MRFRCCSTSIVRPHGKLFWGDSFRRAHYRDPRSSVPTVIAPGVVAARSLRASPKLRASADRSAALGTAGRGGRPAANFGGSGRGARDVSLGSLPPLISVGLESSPPMALAARRAASSGVVLLIVAHFLDRPRVRGRAAWRGVIVVGLTATSVGFFGMFYGGEHVSPWIATVIANTQPLIAGGLAWVLLGEQFSRLQRAALAAGFARSGHRCALRPVRRRRRRDQQCRAQALDWPGRHILGDGLAALDRQRTAHRHGACD